MNYQFQFDAVFAAWPLLLKGTWITIQLSLIATVLGLVVAIFCAWGKTSGPGWLRFIVNAYIEVIRNTPFLVQLFFFFFALPAIGLRWSPHTAALVAMVVNLGAYATEIIRAGIESIPKGQIEAGRRAQPQALGNLPLRHHQARAEGHLPGAHQPVHPADAELGGGVGHLGGRPDLGGRQPAVADLPQLRDLHRGRAIYLALALAFSACSS
jgi:His/Glu/Gln/Arg/opine family amino acid ABC transporter permease subunit